MGGICSSAAAAEAEPPVLSDKLKAQMAHMQPKAPVQAPVVEPARDAQGRPKNQQRQGRTSVSKPAREPAPEYQSVLKRRTGKTLEACYEETPRRLGKGSYGVVTVCIDRETNEELANKTISKSALSKEELDQQLSELRDEIIVMDHLAGHPNIVTLRDVFEDASHLHMVMDLCPGGSLMDLLMARAPIREAEAAHILRIMVKIVTHCHQRGVVHRDIKPDNFLLMQPLSMNPDRGASLELIDMRLADFGLSCFYKQGENEDTSLSERAGSPFYMAPEVVLGKYGPTCDLWSVGVILYFALSGRFPFFHETVDGIFHATLHTQPAMSGKRWRHVSPTAMDLVTRLLCKDPRRRIRANGIFSHAFVRSNAPGHQSVRTSVPSESVMFKPTPSFVDRRDSAAATSRSNLSLGLRSNQGPTPRMSLDRRPSSQANSGSRLELKLSGSRLEVPTGSEAGSSEPMENASVRRPRPPPKESLKEAPVEDDFEDELGVWMVPHQPTLFLPPKEPEDKGRINRFIEAFNNKLNVAYMQLLQAPDQASVELELDVFRGALGALEKVFRTDASPEAEGPYFFGREPCLAESSTAPTALRMLITLPRLRGLNLIDACHARGFNRTAAWLQALAVDPTACCEPPDDAEYVVNMAKQMWVTYVPAIAAEAEPEMPASPKPAIRESRGDGSLKKPSPAADKVMTSMISSSPASMGGRGDSYHELAAMVPPVI